MKQVVLEDLLKRHKDVSKTIAAAKIELFVTLVSSFQWLTNFTNNINIHCKKYRNFTKLPGVKILWKGAVSAKFRANLPKLYGNCAFPKISTRRN